MSIPQPGTIAAFISWRINAGLEKNEVTHRLDITPLVDVLGQLTERHQESGAELLGVIRTGHFQNPTRQKVMIVAATLKCSYEEFSWLLTLASAKAGHSLVGELVEHRVRSDYEQMAAEANAAYAKMVKPPQEAQGPASAKALEKKRQQNPREGHS